MIQTRANSLKGELSIPGDKSISHRAVMIGSIANGITEVTNFLRGADCLSTISCFRKMGVSIEETNDRIKIHGRGLHGLMPPSELLDVGNSGTTTRLLSGILAGQSFPSTLNGDASIQKRPMGRIITPLRLMGANIQSEKDSGLTPLHILPAILHAIEYRSPVASAQVKSSILLAGLYAEGITKVWEPARSRNHTELMLSYFGCDVQTEGTCASVTPPKELYARAVNVPGDISSAAYFMAAAALVPNSEVLVKNVGINPTRDGMIRVMQAMGAKLTLVNVHKDGSEPVADILVSSSNLLGTTIDGDLIPTLIDEIPILAILATQAKGQTIIKDAKELKVKESNRIDVMVDNLTKMGADIIATEDGMIINGGSPLHGAVIDTKLDHRIAMSFAIAALIAEGETSLLHADCVDISYPGFYQDLTSLIVS
ncbi:MAG: 3-phosphoshikimate 1-carboxyvinyltransferase [Clostridiales bacterium]|nr:3-phosphoshikimate 1-carboxyvinyltransferase [Clostridiales bacterium]